MPLPDIIYGAPSKAGINKLAASTRGMDLQISVQGMRTVFEHYVTVPALLNVGSRGIVEITGQMLTGLAREIHRPHILTGDTFNSIGPSDKGSVYADGFGSWTVDVGPRTQQAKFIEWGFLHRNSGRFIRYPFMIPASDVIAPIYRDAMVQLVEVIVSARRSYSNPIAAATSHLDSFRSGLYTFSKASGDLAVLGFGGLSGIRGGALTTAKLLGDVESIMRSALAARVFRRVSGSWASGNLRASTTTTITGPSSQWTQAGQRIVNRFSGFSVGRGFGAIG